MATVQVRELEKRYAAVTALKRVDLTIADGSLTAILGPSGCGKTTLLRCIAGLLTPDGGRVFIGDRDVTRLQPFRRNLGMVFQRPSMFPHMTVHQNIAWGLKLRGWSKSAAIDERIREILRLVRLEGMEQRRYNQLSGGQAQRVVIARALAPRPDLLLLDEPLSALDAKLRLELLAEITDIQRATGCTTLLVTHDQSEALSAATDLVLMNEGDVVQQGDPIEVFRRPASLFAATFVGTKTVLPAFVDRPVDPIAVCLEGGSTRLLAESSSGLLRPGQAVWACIDADDIDLIADHADPAPNRVSVEVVRSTLTAGTVSVEGRLDGHPLRINVGGSRRLELLDRSGQTVSCALSRVVLIPRDPV
ncbi:MAG TPA: ABC transporter ATP-binding protein [Thermomicrobiales bacterium]|jgi:ABC-type Fe3+/spermidine/putrescine transport system ATPase subunit